MFFLLIRFYFVTENLPLFFDKFVADFIFFSQIALIFIYIQRFFISFQYLCTNLIQRRSKLSYDLSMIILAPIIIYPSHILINNYFHLLFQTCSIGCFYCNITSTFFLSLYFTAAVYRSYRRLTGRIF